MDARIMVEFTALNLCSEDDLRSSGMTFEQTVGWIIDSEGLFGIVEDGFVIRAVDSLPDEDEYGDSPIPANAVLIAETVLSATSQGDEA